MFRFLSNLVINLITSTIALLIAAWVLPGVAVTVSGFVAAVVVFVVANAILGPFVFNMARQYAAAMLGGIGLVSTLLALWLAAIFGGLTITGIVSWVLASLIVWVITALGSWILLAVWTKRHLAKRRSSGEANAG